MLCNLKAEMARKQISAEMLAKAVGKSSRSMTDKVAGKFDFTFPECTTIRDKFFPGMSLEYLFAAEQGEQAG